MNRIRERGKKMMKRGGFLWRFVKRWEEHAKGMFVPSTLFEEFGFHYTGPIDGHDLPLLVSTLRTLKELKGPQLLHVITTKGKGYPPAEREQIEYHAVGPFDPETGIVKKAGAAQTDATPRSSATGSATWPTPMRACSAITPAMREGSGLVRFSSEFPERYFDVGIAEQHAVTLAAGMACEGAKPVVAIYSTFLQRAYDQLIHDVALQNLDVTFAIDRGGLVGPDGATHAGSFDLSYLRCIPNMVVMAPADEDECRKMLTTAFLHDGPAAVRYPRGSGTGAACRGIETLPIGKAEMRRRGRGIAILAFGAMVAPCYARRRRRSTRRSSTCASSSRSTRLCSSISRGRTRRSSPSKTMRSPAARGSGVANSSRRTALHSRAAARPCRRIPRSRQPRTAARAGRARRGVDRKRASRAIRDVHSGFEPAQCQLTRQKKAPGSSFDAGGRSSPPKTAFLAVPSIQGFILDRCILQRGQCRSSAGTRRSRAAHRGWLLRSAPCAS